MDVDALKKSPLLHPDVRFFIYLFFFLIARSLSSLPSVDQTGYAVVVMTFEDCVDLHSILTGERVTVKD